MRRALSQIARTPARVGHRAADHVSTSALAVCCSSASLRLVEQPRVLDRDHRLVGKGLQQRDVLVVKACAAIRATPMHRRRHRGPRQHRHDERCGGRPPRHAAPPRSGTSGARWSRRARATARRRCPALTCSGRGVPPASPARAALSAGGDADGGPPAMQHAVVSTSITPTRSASNSCAALLEDPRTPAARRRPSRLITCSTSAVAVCCSSASCVSLNSRTFWIAITAWSAKVCSSAICSAARAGRSRA